MSVSTKKLKTHGLATVKITIDEKRFNDVKTIVKYHPSYRTLSLSEACAVIFGFGVRQELIEAEARRQWHEEAKL